MKYRINYTLDPDGPNETHDSFVVEGDTLELVREIAAREVESARCSVPVVGKTGRW